MAKVGKLSSTRVQGDFPSLGALREPSAGYPSPFCWRKKLQSSSAHADYSAEQWILKKQKKVLQKSMTVMSMS